MGLCLVDILNKRREHLRALKFISFISGIQWDENLKDIFVNLQIGNLRVMKTLSFNIITDAKISLCLFNLRKIDLSKGTDLQQPSGVLCKMNYQHLSANQFIFQLLESARSLSLKTLPTKFTWGHCKWDILITVFSHLTTSSVWLKLSVCAQGLARGHFFGNGMVDFNCWQVVEKIESSYIIWLIR